MTKGWTLKDAARRLKKACMWAGCGYCAQDIPQCRNCGKHRPCAGATYACQQANFKRCGCSYNPRMYHTLQNVWTSAPRDMSLVEQARISTAAQQHLDWCRRNGLTYFK